MPRSGPGLSFREYRLPRRGHRLDECEDASAGDPARGRFAVADGASESSFAALWAKLLVEDFVHAPESGTAWATGLAPLRQRWTSTVAQEPAAPPLPWYLEDRLRQGAFATFLGLVVESAEGPDGPAWRWDALAVGDSCLFQIREGGLVDAFPLARSLEFDNAPWLVGSRTSHSEVLRRQGLGRADDRLWLMTDALAQWFLRQVEAGQRPWDELEPFVPADAAADAFPAWVEGLRGARQLRDDDVTLLAVCLH